MPVPLAPPAAALPPAGPQGARDRARAAAGPGQRSGPRCGSRTGIGPRRPLHGWEARAVVGREPCQGKQGWTWPRDGGGASPETIRRVARGEPENSGSSGAAVGALRPHPALLPSAPAVRRFPRSLEELSRAFSRSSRSLCPFQDPSVCDRELGSDWYVGVWHKERVTGQGMCVHWRDRGSVCAGHYLITCDSFILIFRRNRWKPHRSMVA